MSYDVKTQHQSSQTPGQKYHRNNNWQNRGYYGNNYRHQRYSKPNYYKNDFVDDYSHERGEKIVQNNSDSGYSNDAFVDQQQPQKYEYIPYTLSPLSNIPEVNTPAVTPVINYSVQPSTCDDNTDLPMNDLVTMQFFYNLGIESYGGKQVPDPDMNQIATNMDGIKVSEPSDAKGVSHEYSEEYSPTYYNRGRPYNGGGNKNGYQKYNRYNGSNQNMNYNKQGNEYGRDRGYKNFKNEYSNQFAPIQTQVNYQYQQQPVSYTVSSENIQQNYDAGPTFIAPTGYASTPQQFIQSIPPQPPVSYAQQGQQFMPQIGGQTSYIAPPQTYYTQGQQMMPPVYQYNYLNQPLPGQNGQMMRMNPVAAPPGMLPYVDCLGNLFYVIPQPLAVQP